MLLTHFVVVVVVEDFLAFNTEEEDREDLHFKDVKDVWDKAMVFILVYDYSFVFVLFFSVRKVDF